MCNTILVLRADTFRRTSMSLAQPRHVAFSNYVIRNFEEPRTPIIFGWSRANFWLFSRAKIVLYETSHSYPTNLPHPRYKKIKATQWYSRTAPHHHTSTESKEIRSCGIDISAFKSKISSTVHNLISSKG